MVVICGDSGALGSAFARTFADHGPSLAILDFELDKAITRAASFTAEKIKAIAVAADVSKESSKRRIGWIRGILGGLKIYARLQDSIYTKIENPE